MRRTKILVLMLWIALANPIESPAAQTCQSASIPPSTPTARFADNGNGTVTDTVTGLMWKRCAEGQSWDGTTCAGSAGSMTWQGALQAAESAIFATHSDWRLPSIKELSSIVERQCFDPAINLVVFPSTPSSSFWSSSPAAGNPGIWGVRFHSGRVDYGTSGGSDVRLVRGGQ